MTWRCASTAIGRPPSTGSCSRGERLGTPVLEEHGEDLGAPRPDVGNALPDGGTSNARGGEAGVSHGVLAFPRLHPRLRCRRLHRRLGCPPVHMKPPQRITVLGHSIEVRSSGAENLEPETLGDA